MKKNIVYFLLITFLVQSMELESDNQFYVLSESLLRHKTNFDVALAYLSPSKCDLNLLKEELDMHIKDFESNFLKEVKKEKRFVFESIQDLMESRIKGLIKYKTQVEEEFFWVNEIYNTMKAILDPSMDVIQSICASHSSVITNRCIEDLKEQDKEYVLSSYDLQAMFDDVHRNIANSDIIWKDLLANLDTPSDTFNPKKFIIKNLIKSCTLCFCNHFYLFKEEYTHQKNLINYMIKSYKERYQYYLQQLMINDETLITHYHYSQWPYNYSFTKGILDEALKEIASNKRPSILPDSKDPIFIFYPELRESLEKAENWQK